METNITPTPTPTEKSHPKLIAASVAGIAVAASLAFMAFQQPTYMARSSDDGIPVPFALVRHSPLLGSISTIGSTTTRSGIPVDVRDVLFDQGEISEELKGTVHTDTFDFIVTPVDGTISAGAPLCEAITAGTLTYGYEYTNVTADYERANAGQPVSAQFIGDFFTSPEQRSFDSSITDFETEHFVTFLDWCDVTLKENARYILITNSTETTIQARNVEWCGDVVVNGLEECDDGQGNNTDTCTDQCLNAACGDTYLQPDGADGAVGGGDDEECDDGNTTSEDGCSDQCIIEFCGDNVLQTGLGEQCDDGNNTNGDGCSDSCQIESGEVCGNGVVEGTEECDDGNTSNTDTCTNVCEFAICSDGYLQPSGADGIPGNGDDEECDDGNLLNEDGCDGQCVIEYCGDAIVQTGLGEQCDDANADNTDTCTDSCLDAVCGDGYHQPNGADGAPGTADDEECDDGNQDETDSCDNQCQLLDGPFNTGGTNAGGGGG